MIFQIDSATCEVPLFLSSLSISLFIFTLIENKLHMFVYYIRFVEFNVCGMH